jgi:hypothetical protein
MIRFAEGTISNFSLIVLVFFMGLLLLISDCFAGATSYKIISKKNVDAMGGRVKRQVIHIEIPEGRTREDVEATFRQAVKECFSARKKLNALVVQGYRPTDDRTGQYTIGEAVYAPKGRWSQAANKSAPMKIEITLKNLYFKPRKIIFERGVIVQFVSKKKDVNIYKTQGNWTDDNIWVTVTPGQKGEILRSETWASGDTSITEYKVRVKASGMVGWVPEHNVKLTDK